MDLKTTMSSTFLILQISRLILSAHESSHPEVPFRGFRGEIKECKLYTDD
jgi:hypothetical protein